MNLAEAIRFLRESLATFVIIIAVVAGAAHWMVVPQGRAWKETVARAQALSEEQTQQLDVSSITTRAGVIRDQLSRIQKTSRRSSDSARLYELLLSLGAKAGVEMGRIIPDSTRNDTEFVRGLSFQIAATGSFESMVEFTRLLGDEEVFCRIDKLEIDPRMSESGEEITAMSMRVQFLEFKIAPPLRELAKAES